MRILRSILSTTLVAMLVIALLPHALEAQTATGVKHLAPDALTWQPVEGQPDARIAMLYGNPAEEGHYIVRFRLPADWAGRPHKHGGAELVTVHSGACFLAHGEELTREAARKLAPGTFVSLPAGTKMRAFTGEGGCVVDVQGQGPFTTQYLDEEGDGGS